MKWYIYFEIFVETEFLAVYTISIDFNGQLSFPRDKDFESVGNFGKVENFGTSSRIFTSDSAALFLSTVLLCQLGYERKQTNVVFVGESRKRERRVENSTLAKRYF